jgi:hypothetical protein
MVTWCPQEAGSVAAYMAVTEVVNARMAVSVANMMLIFVLKPLIDLQLIVSRKDGLLTLWEFRMLGSSSTSYMETNCRSRWSSLVIRQP